MPTLARLRNGTITLYARDHQPPHFHVRLNDGREALVEIASLAVVRGNIPQRELAEASDWATNHQALLVQKWKELNP